MYQRLVQVHELGQLQYHLNCLWMQLQLMNLPITERKKKGSDIMQDPGMYLPQCPCVLHGDSNRGQKPSISKNHNAIHHSTLVQCGVPYCNLVLHAWTIWQRNVLETQ